MQGSHSHGTSWKKWSWKVMEKSRKIAKIQNFMEICLPGKKSHGKVMEISCPNPPNRVLLCCDQCGSRLYSLVSLITRPVFRNADKRSWKWIHFHHGKSWKSHGILF